jgi:hypothetical protein
MMRKKGEVVKMIELVSQMMMRSEHAEVVEMIDAESRMTNAAKKMMKMVNESVSVKIAAEIGVIGDNERAKRKIAILTLAQRMSVGGRLMRLIQTVMLLVRETSANAQVICRKQIGMPTAHAGSVVNLAIAMTRILHPTVLATTTANLAIAMMIH